MQNLTAATICENWELQNHHSNTNNWLKYLWVEPKESISEFHYVCMWDCCSKRLHSIESLDEHLEIHVNTFIQAGSNLSCRIRGCEILVSSEEELLRHIKMHIFHAQKLAIGLLQVRHRHNNLEGCNFASSSRLVYQGDALICEWSSCSKIFSDINKYMEHLSEHINSNFLMPYKCKWRECEMTFKSKCLLRLHIQHHSGDKTCACPFCGMFFVNNSKLLDHVNRRQEGDLEFSCYFCQKIFKTPRLLKSHCKRHLRNFRCKICATALESAFDLQRHMATVHAKIHNYFCEICKKGFFQKSDLRRHLNIHTQKLPYECHFCEKKFRWDKQLRHHMKAHQEDYIESPYHCHLCDATYRRGSALSKHLMRSHQITIPSGFSRFQYKKCADSLYRLQTRRWTGVEVNATNEIEMRCAQFISACNRRSITFTRYFCDLTAINSNQSPKNFSLSEKFSLDEAWFSRFNELARHKLEGGYEWISTVQKKFASSGSANAIDVDIAAQLSQEEDQRKDLVDLMYRFRHTPNACDLLPSTEYAVFRMLLRYDDWKNIFIILNDPINYGLFMNEHISCLAINQLLCAGDLSGAAKISTCAMQQETFDFSLVNFFALFSLAKWVEQPERIMNETIQPPTASVDLDQYDDDELTTMKFPFLKNNYFDNHFDLNTSDELVRKSLLWFSWNLPSELPQNARNELSIRIKSMLSSEEPNTIPFILMDNITPLSVLIEEMFAPILPNAESILMNHQLNLFNSWNERRLQLIKAQAERLNLILRLNEIKKRQVELIDEKKVLFFFENRIKWEEESRAKDKLFDDFKLNVKEADLTEKEYADTLFDTARRITQGDYISPHAQKSAIVDEEAQRKLERRRLLLHYGGKYIPKTVHNLRRREVPPLIGKLRADEQLEGKRVEQSFKSDS